MNSADETPCVVLWCEASKFHFVWLEKIWNKDAEHWEKTGRKLIASAPFNTCHVLRDLLNQQLESNHAN